MRKKITWLDIYNDFKVRLPNLSKGAVHYQPNGYLSILIFFADGSKMVYDYLSERASFLVMPPVSQTR